MGQSYFEERANTFATFDLFSRTLPKNRSFFVGCGLEDVLRFLENLRFDPESLDFLESKKIFSRDFLEYLSKFKFSGDVYALKEGEIFFPNEPILRVTAPIIEAQIIESFLLNTINLQTTIATKAVRCVLAAKDKGVYDFSLRRTQGSDAALKAARCSYIAGCKGTSNVLAGKIYGIPIVGTMAHSYVMSFESELASFLSFSKTFPENSILLIDTYNNLEGLKNAIFVAKELEKKGKRLRGVRLDSGDLVKISKRVREILDKNKLNYVKIFASGNLDEYKIEELLENKAPIDDFGVGTNMGVSTDLPFTDVIYKISEISNNQGEFLPTMKLSKGKFTYPGRKQIYRIRDKDGFYKEDILGLEGEKIEGEPLLVCVMKDGKITYNFPKLDEIQKFLKENLERFPSKYKELKRRFTYPVKISPKLKRLTLNLKKALETRSKRGV
jgi:nicotinate phosphoribosyltransferase